MTDEEIKKLLEETVKRVTEVIGYLYSKQPVTVPSCVDIVKLIAKCIIEGYVVVISPDGVMTIEHVPNKEKAL